MSGEGVVYDHGPTVLVVSVALVVLRHFFAGGLRITIAHDEDQLKKLVAELRALAEPLSKDIREIRAEMNRMKARAVELQVRVDERTRRRASERTTTVTDPPEHE